MREACLITFGGARGRHASQVLVASGFNVHPVRPRSVDASEEIRNFTRSALSALSNKLTQNHIWTHPCSHATYTYVFEDDIELPRITPQTLHLQLDHVESLRPRMLYLGTCAEHWSGMFVAKNWTRCAPLCAHAYAVRNTAADNATRLTRDMESAARRRSSSFYKTNWDVIMRGYFVHTQAKESWPLCSNPNIFFQNRTRFPSIISSVP